MNTVVIASTNRWNGLLGNVNAGRGYIAAQNPPFGAGVAAGRWVKNLGVKHVVSGQPMLLPRYDKNQLPGGLAEAVGNLVDDVFNGLVQGASVVMIDELTLITEELIANAANVFAQPQYKPYYQHLWGAYIVNGAAVSYANLQVGLAYLFMANARVAPEFYVYYNHGANVNSHVFNYIESGGSDGARDVWLGEFFSGGDVSSPTPSAYRLAWLIAYRAGWSSQSRVHPILGVTDNYLTSSSPPASGDTAARMLDRMFYVFATRTGFGGLMRDTNDGGVGSWKWDAAAIGGAYTGRDEAFAASYGHYCIAPYLTSSRLGPVPPP